MKKAFTEADVRAAAAARRDIVLDAGQILTPAAADLAPQLGVAVRDRLSLSNRVVIGSDHGGYELKEALKPVLSSLGFEVEDVGCNSKESVDYPTYAARVADAVAGGSARWGIMVDGAGIGSCMVCNKVIGVRAAMCYDRTTAHNAREHNDANVLTLGGTLLGVRLASEIVEVFLATPFAGGRHSRRVAMINALDGRPPQS